MWKIKLKGRTQIILDNRPIEKLVQASREEFTVPNEGLKAKEVEFTFSQLFFCWFIFGAKFNLSSLNRFFHWFISGATYLLPSQNWSMYQRSIWRSWWWYSSLPSGPILSTGGQNTILLIYYLIYRRYVLIFW